MQDVLEAAQWPEAKFPVLVVGHQPSLGEVAAQLLGMQTDSCPIRKGAVWWLRSRQREGVDQTIILSVTTPEKL